MNTDLQIAEAVLNDEKVYTRPKGESEWKLSTISKLDFQNFEYCLLKDLPKSKDDFSLKHQFNVIEARSLGYEIEHKKRTLPCKWKKIKKNHDFNFVYYRYRIAASGWYIEEDPKVIIESFLQGKKLEERLKFADNWASFADDWVSVKIPAFDFNEKEYRIYI